MKQRSRALGLFAEDGLSPEAERRLASFSMLFGAVTFVLGLAGTAGWFFDIPVLRHVIPGFPAIRPLSAVCLSLLGAGLWFTSERPRLSALLAVLACAVASLSLVDSFSHTEQTIRRLLVPENPDLAYAAEVASRSGFTNPFAALGYALLSVALVARRYPNLVSLAQTLAITITFVALVPLLGFVYRIETLSSPIMQSVPSLQGTLGITLLALGICFTSPQRGVIGLLAGQTAGSRAARRQLIPALVLPVILGGIFIYARQTGSIDIDAAVPTFVSALAATLAGSVLWAARGDARMEILQRRSEGALRETADASPLMTWMSDATGTVTHVNPAALKMIGASLSDVVNGGWLHFLHEEDIPVVQREVRSAIAARRAFSAEYRIRHADNSWRWVLGTAMPRFTPTQDLAGYTGNWVDITERKNAEVALHRLMGELETRVDERTAALRASKEELARQTNLLESTVKSMGDALLAVSNEGQILLWNDAAARVFGASLNASDASSRNFEYGYFLGDGMTPFPTEELPLMRGLRGERTDNVMMVVRHEDAPDGIWVRITGRPILDNEGAIVGSIIVGHDVTDFEKAQEATRRLAAVVESSGDAILSVTLDGRISTWNRGAEQIYGYKAEEIIGKPLSRLDPSEDGNATRRMLDCLSDGAVLIRGDASGRRRDGTLVDIAATMSPIHDEAGKIEAFSVVHHDVSHLKAVERRIQALNDELEQRVRERTAALLAANHDLENYASSVAHDLRTPVRAIAGFARVLEEDYAEAIGDEGMRVVGIVRKNAQDMGQFIDALLSFSAVDRPPPNKEQVDVAEIVRECVDSLAQEAVDREIAFHVGDLPSCHADRASLKQVFLNLLGNAVKFTRRASRPHIEVGSRIEPCGAVAYYVRDNGVGFDMSNTRRLFGLFQRLHKPSDFEGTGLGLANVARIVAAHGGKVWADAEPGKGATFHFIIEQREGAVT